MRQGLNYLRVSSRRQVDKGFDEDGLSLPAQREACARYADDHAITIVGEYIERGESARMPTGPSSKPCWPASNKSATSRS